MPTDIELLHNLDDDPRTPSTVDIQRAIQSGRRIRRNRGYAYAGAAAATTLAVAGVAIFGIPHGNSSRPAPVVASKSASPKASPKPAYTIPGTKDWTAPVAAPVSSCTLDRLTVPGGVAQALISSADPTGQYIVGRSYPKDGYQAVLWHNGKGRNINLPGDLEESLTDVNSSGAAVGWSWISTGGADGPVPYAYQGGKVVKLTGPKLGYANAINDAGAIAGSDEVAHDALIWSSVTAKPTKLPVPSGTQAATAADIDEDGTTVGSLDLKVPYVWFADGTHKALPLPTYKGKKAVSARAFHVRNGWVTGVADANEEARNGGGNDADMWSVRWNLRTGEVKVFPDLLFGANGVNASGWQTGLNAKSRAVLVLTDGKRIELPQLSPHPVGTLNNIPYSISDDGKTITGQSDDAGDTIHAVVWHCK
jgi:uncharacterized membrane protein